MRGTPTFFIDGRPVTGAQPIATFKQIIDDELGRADDLLRRGLPRDKLYVTLLDGAKPAMGSGATMAASATVYRVPTLDAPVRGGGQPKVTVVEFGDFQCPFSARVHPTLQALLKTYGPDVALVFRHNPLPFHDNAVPAALAAEAARQQGKFWEMHDKLFAHPTELDRASLDRYAAELGLDTARFKADLDAEVGEGKDRIARDTDDAARFTTGGTPWFFINGRSLSGAQPIEVFKQAIDEEVRKANALLAAGTPRGDLYAALTRAGLDKKAEPPAAKPDPDADLRIRVDVTGAPARGPADAPITIVEWSDFQCPFCVRAEETLTRLRQEYPDKIRFVWRDLPLPFHDQARPAAIAARAAGAQGKFWAMHDRLYADQGAPLGRERFEKDAGELGLDGKRFRAALDAEEGKSAIDADLLAATKAGATGTPTFFINGKVLSGAQPYETFKARIDDELKVTDAMIAKGTPRARLYAALMKDALPVRPPKAAKNERGRRTRAGGRHQGLSGQAGRRAVEGAGERAAGGGGLLRLPVPLLQAGRADAGGDGEALSRQGAHRLEELSAPLSRQRHGGRRGGDGRRRAGEVLADARPAVRQQQRARSGEPGERRRRGGARSAALPRRPRRRALEDPDRGRQAGGERARRGGDARRLHQRPQDCRRLPVRDLPEDRRRRARQARQARPRPSPQPKRQKPPVSQNGRLRRTGRQVAPAMLRAT